MKLQTILPVIVSILVIIAVAIIERQSKFAAAITATMPLGVPLALWIVYSANQGDPRVMQELTRGMVIGIIPTLGFVIAAWLCARAGIKLVPMLAIGYLVWGVMFGISLVVKQVLEL
jgi:CDP-diglyceride synthetase